MESSRSNELSETTSSSQAGQALAIRPKKKKKQGEPLPLQFITSTGSSAGSKGDVEVRRLIRAHARRSGGNKGHEKSASEGAVEIGKNEVVKYDKKLHTSRFKLSTWSRTPSKKIKGDDEPIASEEEEDMKLIVQYIMGNNTLPPVMDPLNPLPVPFLPQVKRMLQFYAVDFWTNSFALNPDGSQFDQLKRHPASLYAFLAVLAQFRVYQYNLTNDPDEAYFTLEAVKRINDLMNEEHKQGTVSDALMMAVAAMVNKDSTRGSFEQATIHMNGMENLVKLRGGLEAWNHLPSLQRVVTWSDFCYAVACGKPLRFPILPNLSNSLRISDRFMTRSIVDVIHFRYTDLVVSNREMFEAMEMLQTIIEALTEYTLLGTGDRVIISNSIYVVEYRLSSLNHRSQRDRGLDYDLPSDTGRLDLSEALGMATHIFLHLGIRSINVQADRHRRPFLRLYAALPHERDFSMLIAPRFYLCLLLWICAVGASDEKNQVARNFFIRSLSQVCSNLLIQTREDFEICLREILWIDPLCEVLTSKLWDDLTTLWLNEIVIYASPDNDNNT